MITLSNPIAVSITMQNCLSCKMEQINPKEHQGVPQKEYTKCNLSTSEALVFVWKHYECFFRRDNMELYPLKVFQWVVDVELEQVAEYRNGCRSRREVLRPLDPDEEEEKADTKHSQNPGAQHDCLLFSFCLFFPAAGKGLKSSHAFNTLAACQDL